MMNEWTRKVMSCHLVYTEMDILQDAEGTVLVESFGIGERHKINVLTLDDSELKNVAMRYIKAHQQLRDNIEKAMGVEVEG